jgi:hypothetical protein
LRVSCGAGKPFREIFASFSQHIISVAANFLFFLFSTPLDILFSLKNICCVAAQEKEIYQMTYNVLDSDDENATAATHPWILLPAATQEK